MRYSSYGMSKELSAPFILYKATFFYQPVPGFHTVNYNIQLSQVIWEVEDEIIAFYEGKLEVIEQNNVILLLNGNRVTVEMIIRTDTNWIGSYVNVSWY